jgi:molybdopterin/thiamine biosynthesis adenylyltransferase
MALVNEIFSRERLAGYEPERLAQSVALIVGAGALGQNVALNLALSGVGEIRIVDRDEFEPHNRTRSPLFPLPEEQARYGLDKSRAVAVKLRPLMTAARPLVRYARAWIQALGDGAFKDVSVILACVDKPSARAYLSDKARLHGIPLIEAGFDAADISLSCFPAVRGQEAHDAPCWRCANQETEVGGGLFSCAAYARQADEAGFIPAIQNAAATLAGLQAEAAVLSLHEENRSPLEFRAMDLNIRTGLSRVIKLSTDPFCPGLHRTLDAVPNKLGTSAGDTVEQLMKEVSEFLGGSACVELESPLVWTAACQKCTKMVDVRSPMWQWAMSLRCQSCQGAFPLAVEEMTDTPLIHYYLDSESPDEILKATCAEMGFPPLALIETSVGDQPARLFELAGSLEHLYESGEKHGQQPS